MGQRLGSQLLEHDCLANSSLSTGRGLKKHRARHAKDELNRKPYGFGFISFMFFMSFMSHESPQQPSLSAAIACFFMPSFFFMSHESPQQPQQPPLSAAMTWFFMPSFFFMSHESPQQLQQHEAFLSPLVWFAL